MNIRKIYLKLVGVCILLSTTTGILSAQDLIVTNGLDSLNCKITDVKSDFIYFTFMKDEVVRNTLLPRSEIVNYQYNFYNQQVLPSGIALMADDYPHFRVAVNGGWSRRTARLSDDLTDQLKTHLKGLMTGYHIGADAEYFIIEQFGLGAEYRNFRSSNQIDNITFQKPDGTFGITSLNEEIDMMFIAPVASYRLLDAKKKNALIMDLGVGYLGYYDNISSINNVTITGGTMGVRWGIGYDFMISDNYAIGLQFSMLSGTLTQIEISDGTTTESKSLEADEYESLSRIDLSIGFRFIR